MPHVPRKQKPRKLFVLTYRSLFTWHCHSSGSSLWTYPLLPHLLIYIKINIINKPMETLGTGEVVAARSKLGLRVCNVSIIVVGSPRSSLLCTIKSSRYLISPSRARVVSSSSLPKLAYNSFTCKWPVARRRNVLYQGVHGQICGCNALNFFGILSSIVRIKLRR